MRQAAREPAPLFADAEGGEDAVEDVVGGSGAGNGVDRAEGGVEVEQQHLVGDLGVDGAAGFVETGEGFAEELLVAEVGDESGLAVGRGDGIDDGAAELGDAVAGEGGDGKLGIA